MPLLSHSFHRLLLVCGAIVIAVPSAVAPLALAADAPAKVTYDDHVKPIFRAKCFSCHNTDKKIGGLDLTSYISMMQGGSSGEVIDPGSASDSYLFNLVNHDLEPYMPPNSEKMSADALATITKWIDGGALENSGSKPLVSKKPKVDLALTAAPGARPEGAPPMPLRLSKQPVVHAERTTAVTAIATNPWSSLTAVAGQNQVLLYDATSLKLLGVLPFPEGVPQVLRFSRNGQLLLAGGGQGGAKGVAVLWNVKTGERVTEVGDEYDAVLAADISGDQTRIALGGPGKIVRIYSTADGRLLHEIKKHTDWIYALEFSPDGVLLATADRNGGMFVWEAMTAREYLALDGHKQGITSLSWRSDSNILASASEDAQIRLWEMERGNNVKTWTAHGGGVQSVEFARDGRLVSCGRDKLTKLWDQAGKQLRAYEAFTDLALKVSISDDAKRVIAGDWNGEIRVWNSEDGTRTGTLTANPPMLADQLSAATADLQAKQAEQAKLQTAYDATKAAVDKAKADLAAATKAVTDQTNANKAATALVAELKGQIAKLTAERDAAMKTAAELEPVVTPLREALAKAEAAAAKAADDKELAAAVAALKTQHDPKAATLATATQTVAARMKALTEASTKQAAAEKQVTDSAAALKTAQQQVTALTPVVKAADEKATAAKSALDAAAQATAQAQAQTALWESEITFHKRLQDLAARQTVADEAEAVAAEAAAAVAQMQAQLKTATDAVAAAKTKLDTATAAVTTSKQQLTQATAAMASTQKSLAELQALVPALAETLEKAKVAQTKAPADKEVAAALNALQALVTQKTAAVETTKKDVAAKSAALEAAKQQVAAAEKAAADAGAAQVAATKQVETLTASLKPLQEKATASEKTAADARTALAAMQKEIEQFRTSGGDAGTARADAGS